MAQLQNDEAGLRKLIEQAQFQRDPMAMNVLNVPMNAVTYSTAAMPSTSYAATTLV